MAHEEREVGEWQALLFKVWVIGRLKFETHRGSRQHSYHQGLPITFIFGGDKGLFLALELQSR